MHVTFRLRCRESYRLLRPPLVLRSSSSARWCGGDSVHGGARAHRFICGLQILSFSISSFLDSRYYCGVLTLMQCTLRFAFISSSSLLLYPPCMNVCRDLKPHEWDGHHVRRKSRRPSEVSTIGTPDNRLELPTPVRTLDPMVTTPFMFLHFLIFVSF